MKRELKVSSFLTTLLPLLPKESHEERIESRKILMETDLLLKYWNLMKRELKEDLDVVVSDLVAQESHEERIESSASLSASPLS